MLRFPAFAIIATQNLTRNSKLETRNSKLSRVLRRNSCSRISTAKLGLVALSKRIHHFVVEVVIALRHFRPDALVIHFAGAVNVLPETLIEITLGTTLRHLLLVIEFDF